MRSSLSACCGVWLLALVASACSSDSKPDNGAGASGADTSGAGASGADAGGSAGEAESGEEGSEFALFPLPNSAELTLPNPSNYDVSTTLDVVNDLITGLSWPADPDTIVYTRADAISYCAELSLGGADDWRVPTFIELTSLFDVVSHGDAPLHPIYISPVFQAEGRFWTTSPGHEAGLGRLVDFSANGCSDSQACSIGVSGDVNSPLGGAFCVRTPLQPSPLEPRYQVDGDQVTDLHTGLIWFNVLGNAQTGTQAEAASTCAALGDAVRLPSVNELLSIVVPLLNTQAFPNWPADAFAWTSSEIAAKPGTFWAAAIGGASEAADSASHNRVQCVR